MPGRSALGVPGATLAPVLILLSLLAGEAHAACDTLVSANTLGALGVQVEEGLMTLDKDRVLEAAQLSADAVPCLTEPLTPELAAQYHRSQGYAAFLSGDRDAALLHFTASALVSPDYELPESLVPAAHPIAKLYDEGRGAQDPKEQLEQPAQGFLVFDGASTDLRPTARPTVGQYVDERGELAFSVALAPADTVPAYPTPIITEPSVAEPGAELRWPLVAAAAGAAIGSGGLYLASVKSEEAYYESTSVAGAESQRRRTHTLTVLAGTSATAAVGLGVGVVVMSF